MLTWQTTFKPLVKRGYKSTWGLAKKLLPTSLLVRMRDQMRLVERLDYARQPIWMYVDAQVQIGRLQACSKEPETVQWIEANVKAGDAFYDIGANVGAYSFVADAAAGGGATVYAFEPSFATFSALSQNILLNRCQGRIVPFQVALWHETKVLMLEYSDVVPGAALHHLEEQAPSDSRKPVTPILSFRLDDFIRDFGLRPPNHIKLDVDGAEVNVLRGAEQTLADPALRSLLVEVEDTNSREIIDFLRAKGLEVHERHLRRESGELANYVFKRGYHSEG